MADVAPAFRCETGRENTVVRVISLTIQSVYSVAMLRRLKAYNRPGSGLSKTVMNHTRKWLRVKLKLNQVAKLQKTLGSVSKRSCSHEEKSTESPVSKLRHDGMRHANKTTVKALHGSPHTL